MHVNLSLSLSLMVGILSGFSIIQNVSSLFYIYIYVGWNVCACISSHDMTSESYYVLHVYVYTNADNDRTFSARPLISTK